MTRRVASKRSQEPYCNRSNHFKLMQSKQQVDFFEIVVDLLVEHFVNPLNQLSRQKNYFVHVASLAEIVDWSEDFYNQYSDLPNNWETFKTSGRNIFKVDNINDFVVAFGHAKFKMFCIENGNYPDYFLRKYSALELNADGRTGS